MNTHHLRCLLIFSWLVLGSCMGDEEVVPVVSKEEMIMHLSESYELLPEAAISVSDDESVFAQYASPTRVYGHGILGDKVEAKMLVVATGGEVYELSLGEDFVFEDIRPRLYDVDGDGDLEIITIRTQITAGAGIAIYTIADDRLVEYAHVPVINKAYRWLNIVTIDDLDQDGTVELVWIETPHIGGILKVAKITSGVLEVTDQQREYSNHAIGERNLCLSTLALSDNQRVFYVPYQERDSIAGFSYSEGQLNLISTAALDVDFSKKLSIQYDFLGIIDAGVNCID